MLQTETVSCSVAVSQTSENHLLHASDDSLLHMTEHIVSQVNDCDLSVKLKALSGINSVCFSDTATHELNCES